MQNCASLCSGRAVATNHTSHEVCVCRSTLDALLRTAVMPYTRVLIFVSVYSCPYKRSALDALLRTAEMPRAAPLWHTAHTR